MSQQQGSEIQMANMSAPILITVPKYITISPNPQNGTDYPSQNTSSTDLLSEGESSGRGKKRRLDHLTWEEKMQRKKLKNRVAAQTSRDRKKAKVDEMENTIKVLTQKTEMLQNKCDSLQSINESLLLRNEKLGQQVEYLERQLDELKNHRFQNQQDQGMNVSLNSDNVNCGSTFLYRSAVSNNPLPKGMEPKLTVYENKDNSAVAHLWKIVALCLLYKTCSKISMQENWKNLPKVYSQISPQTWKLAIQQAAMMMPKVQAVKSDCLDQWWGPQQKSWNPAKISVKV